MNRDALTYYRPDGADGLELVVVGAGPNGDNVVVPVDEKKAARHLKSLAVFICDRKKDAA